MLLGDAVLPRASVEKIAKLKLRWMIRQYGSAVGSRKRKCGMTKFYKNNDMINIISSMMVVIGHALYLLFSHYQKRLYGKIKQP